MFRFSVAAAVFLALFAWTTRRPRGSLTEDDRRQATAIVARHTTATILTTSSPEQDIAEVQTLEVAGPYSGSVYTLKRTEAGWLLIRVGCWRQDANQKSG